MKTSDNPPILTFPHPPEDGFVRFLANKGGRNLSGTTPHLRKRLEMRGHETFEHTADIGIRAWGSELTQVFEEAAKALFSVIVDLKTVSPHRKLKIELNLPLTPTLSTEGRGEGEGELFLAWLKELLFIFDTKRFLISEVKILKLELGTVPKNGDGPQFLKLIAEVWGESLNNSKHALGKEVKAITRHQFKFTQDQSRYLTEVILDI